MTRPRDKSYSDYLGIASATICLIHCLAGPVVLGATAHAHDGHAAHWLADHRWDYFFLLLGLAAVWYSARHTAHRAMKVLLWLTYAFLAASILLETQAWIFRYLVYGASAGLIVAHLLNLRQMLRRHMMVSAD